MWVDSFTNILPVILVKVVKRKFYCIINIFQKYLTLDRIEIVTEIIVLTAVRNILIYRIVKFDNFMQNSSACEVCNYKFVK